MKLPVDVFFNRIKDATFNLEDSEKIEFYEELLETGSATVSINNNLEFNFKIESFDWEVVETEQIDIDDIDLKEIDDIVKADVDDDPINFELLELESNDETDEYRVLSEQELMEIGYNPWTNEKIDFDSLNAFIDDYIRIITEILDNALKKGLEYSAQFQREKLVHFNFIKTIVKFYEDKTKLQASDGEEYE